MKCLDACPPRTRGQASVSLVPLRDLPRVSGQGHKTLLFKFTFTERVESTSFWGQMSEMNCSTPPATPQQFNCREKGRDGGEREANEKEMTAVETQQSGAARTLRAQTFYRLVLRRAGVSAKTAYRIVDGFQCFPLGLVLGFQLGVGVPVKFLEFLYHLQWTEERGAEQMNQCFHGHMSPGPSYSRSANRLPCRKNVTRQTASVSGCLQGPPLPPAASRKLLLPIPFSSTYGWSLQPHLAPCFLSMNKMRSLYSK